MPNDEEMIRKVGLPQETRGQIFDDVIKEFKARNDPSSPMKLYYDNGVMKGLYEESVRKEILNGLLDWKKKDCKVMKFNSFDFFEILPKINNALPTQQGIILCFIFGELYSAFMKITPLEKKVYLLNLFYLNFYHLNAPKIEHILLFVDLSNYKFEITNFNNEKPSIKVSKNDPEKYSMIECILSDN